jgi:hypothetical protein
VPRDGKDRRLPYTIVRPAAELGMIQLGLKVRTNPVVQGVFEQMLACSRDVRNETRRRPLTASIARVNCREVTAGTPSAVVVMPTSRSSPSGFTRGSRFPRSENYARRPLSNRAIQIRMHAPMKPAMR